ncbi:hypothetical protein B0H13DRAFT_1916328 [Mycena leptocephala]|nr:hypothetical protein B0H13DRAFT_2380657 [Mycena leptocephala]KAJ7829723.1 hypothetical protein B0H13DRAFT_1916328 [Mycena leptocephala]
MRLPLPSPGRKPLASTAKLKSLSSQTSALPDLMSTSLLALKESADAFPPLKSAVGGVLAVWDIAQRARHFKSDARDIALRTEKILNVIADAVPDGSVISPSMLHSIERFTVLLDEIRSSVEMIALTNGISRIVHLNRNERALQEIKAQLDDAYRDFLAASALRAEAQQTKIAVQQTLLATQIHLDVEKAVVATDSIVRNLSRVSLYSSLSVFLASP